MQDSTERAVKPRRRLIRSIARGLAIVLGVVLVLVGVLGFWFEYSVPPGFPDGYVSPYHRDMHGLYLVSLLVDFLLGLLGLAYGIRPSRGTALVSGLTFVVFLLLILMPDQIYEIVNGHPPDPNYGQGG